MCEAVWHFCPESKTACKDCGGRLLKITEKTYWKKFAGNYFQYDYRDLGFYKPQKPKSIC